MGMQARELDGRLVGLGPGIGEEHPIHAGQLGDQGPQALLLSDPIEVRGVDQSARLLAEGGGQGRVGVTETAHRHTGQGVQVAFALVIPEPDPLAPLEEDGQALVGRHQGIAHGAVPDGSFAGVQKAKRRFHGTGNRLEC